MKQKTKDILRWVGVLPAICLVWLAITYTLGALVIGLVYSLGLFESYFWLTMFLSMCVLPGIAMFFAARYIAPKYKNISGICAVILCVIWWLFLFYGITNMGY